MNKILLSVVFVILLLCTSVALAEDFTGYKYSGDEFTLNGDNFTLKLSGNEQSLIIEKGDDSYLLTQGDCKTTVEYKYCFYTTNIDLSEGIGKISYHTDKDIPAINMSIISLKPDITITRTVSDATPLEFEDVTINVKIINEGKKKAQIKFIELIDAPAFIESCSNCIITNNNKLEYQSPIHAGDEDLFSYKINPNGVDSLVITPNITYTSETANGLLEVAGITITPQKPLLITYSGVKDIIIENIVKADIFINNTDTSRDIDYSTSLTFADNLIVSLDERTILDAKNPIILSGKLDANEGDQYRIYLLGKKSGNAQVNVSTNYTLASQKLKTNTTFAFDVVVVNPVFTFDVITSMFSDTDNRVTLTIDNSESKNSFQDMKITTTLDEYINEKFSIPFLKYSRVLTAYDNDFTIIANQTKTVNAKADISYKTLYGEEFNTTVTKSITVKPILDMLTVEHELIEFLGKEGDFIVNLYVSNNDVDIKEINVSEEITDATVLNFEGRSLKNYKDITTETNYHIGPKLRKKVFTYVLKQEELNTSKINTKISLKGAKNTYLIDVNSEIDFIKATGEVKNSSISVISTGVLETKSGVLSENINVENTWQYDLDDVETTKVEQEVEEKQEEETQIETTPTNNVVEPEQEVSLWDKIKNIIFYFLS